MKVVPYSIDQLVQLIVECTPNNPETVTSRSHRGYFEGYFNYIGARTILAEPSYIDRDYLEDFAGYYVRCFEDYGKQCTRLHFFTTDFSQAEFESSLVDQDSELSSERLSEAYLGFIVVKPLHTNPIGRTCLRTYPENNHRKYPVLQTYEVGLYGHSLTVTSLAFQEQDRVVAACATSAIWTALQGTGKKFHHTIPSPFQITRKATKNSTSNTRSMPNRGLTGEMMARAIKGFGLEPYAISVTPDDFLLRATVAAYLRAGIPLLLMFELNEVVGTPGTLQLMGGHAVAITGYSDAKPTPTAFGPTNFLSASTRMDKLYVHDDGVGPFARMIFDSYQATFGQPPNVKTRPLLSTSWAGRTSNSIGTVYALPILLMVPLYHKIRIAFDEILDLIIHFDAAVFAARATTPLAYADPFEWDVYLDTVNSIKKEFLGKDRPELMAKPLPRYIWRAKATVNGADKLELLFDATGISQGRNLIYVFEHDSDVVDLLKVIANLPDARNKWASAPSWNILRWFRQS